MRRDFELIRRILLAIADQNVRTGHDLIASLDEEPTQIDYHLRLLINDTNVLRGNRSITTKDWEGLELTWAGNDLLAAVGDDKLWRKVSAALQSGAKLATIEALKVVAKGAATAGLATVLAEADEAAQATSEKRESGL